MPIFLFFRRIHHKPPPNSCQISPTSTTTLTQIPRSTAIVKKQQRARTAWKSTTTRLFKQQSLEDNHDKITQDTPSHHPQDATKDFCHRNLRDKQHLTNTEADDLHQGHDADQEDRKARLFEDKNKQWAEKLRKKHEERRP